MSAKGARRRHASGAARRADVGPGVPERRTKPAALARPRRAPWILVAFVVIIAAIVWSVVRRPENRRVPAPPVGDSASSLSSPEAYERALAIARQDHPAESLPYFRRALAGVRQDFWEIHFDYSAALYNLTRAYQVRRGIQVPLLRSAFERVRVMQESLHELDRAERLARAPRDLAAIQAHRAQIMEVWGFPWETLEAYRQVRHLDPARTDLVERGEIYAKLMRTPLEVSKD